VVDAIGILCQLQHTRTGQWAEIVHWEHMQIILIYPVVSGVSEYSHKRSFCNLLGTDDPTEEQLKSVSIELNVGEDASPVYIVHGADDTCVPVENTLLLAAAYSKRKIPFEVHIYPEGEHAFALANNITCYCDDKRNKEGLSNWVELAAKWTDKIK
jgi:acetyl esterase/lipase